jgi:protein TonB
MAKPLISADPTPRSVQFSHFGVLDAGANSKSAFLTSAGANIAILLVLVLIGSAVKNVVAPPNKLDTLVVPVKEQPKPPPPKVPPPPPPKPLPEPPKLEEAKIKPPDPVKLPPDIKPVVVPTPHINLAPPAPKAVIPPPAPKVVNLRASAASVPNNDPHPSAVRLGRPDSPLKSSMTGPPVSNVNLSAGMPGMNRANSGSGPRATSVHMGSGSPNGTNLNGRSNAAVPVKGLSNGVPGGTGTGTHGPVRVEIAPPAAATTKPLAPSVTSPLAKAPVVTFVPKPVYSSEARAMHLEGDAQVRINFRANGSVQVLGLTHGLGHGLDQAALTAAAGIRFKPATNAAGQPIDYPTTITVHFLVN